MTITEIKLKLLIHGISIDHNSIKGFSYKTEKYQHNDRHFVKRKYKMSIPQELILNDSKGKSVCVGVLVRNDSPYRLKCENVGPIIIFNGKKLNIKIEFVKEPTFWTMCSSEGIPLYKFMSVPGINELNLWLWHDCAFHYCGQGCKFCTTTRTALSVGTGPGSGMLTAYDIVRQSDEVLKKKNSLIKQFKETVNSALKYDFENSNYWLSVIAGSLPEQYDTELYKLCAHTISEICSDAKEINKNRIVANIMPTNNIANFRKIMLAGVSHYMGNIELWDEEMFQKICPGKARFGRERFIACLSDAVKVFGTGRVWCNFVCGLESFEKQLEGYEILAKSGVVCGSNVFHMDPNVLIRPIYDFNYNAIKDYYKEAANILRNYKLKPFYNLESRRSSMLWEAYLGWL